MTRKCYELLVLRHEMFHSVKIFRCVHLCYGKLMISQLVEFYLYGAAMEGLLILFVGKN